MFYHPGKLFTAVLFYFQLRIAFAKTKCEICTDIVGKFQEGLEKTVKSNFGGGNTNWEEKSLGKWKTSETRLVEIIEHHICPDSDKKCHMFYENNEESLEDWYFNVYVHEDTADSLYDHWCVTSTKVCCSAKMYGKNCDLCPIGKNGEVCSGHGKCDGEKTRGGTGECKCEGSHTGELCDECNDLHYEESVEDEVPECLACHEACDEGCTGPGVLSCESCKSGWVWEDDSGCIDVDECSDDKSPCKSNQYCVNSEGSYKCHQCSRECSVCIGEGSHSCTKCNDGYQMIEETNEDNSTSQICQDIDECEDSDICSEYKGSSCKNTRGSYECKCPSGQTLIDDICTDEPPPPPPSKKEYKEASGDTKAPNHEEL